MSTIKTITMPDGSQAKAQEVDFQPQIENWNQYTLQDGTVVKVKTTVLKILLCNRRTTLVRLPRRYHKQQ